MLRPRRHRAPAQGTACSAATSHSCHTRDFSDRATTRRRGAHWSPWLSVGKRTLRFFFKFVFTFFSQMYPEDVLPEHMEQSRQTHLAQKASITGRGGHGAQHVRGPSGSRTAPSTPGLGAAGPRWPLMLQATVRTRQWSLAQAPPGGSTRDRPPQPSPSVGITTRHVLRAHPAATCPRRRITGEAGGSLPCTGPAGSEFSGKLPHAAQAGSPETCGQVPDRRLCRRGHCRGNTDRSKCLRKSGPQVP